ncbi:MAG TPA: Uma2 family endonuclease [Gemmataceae bacterium]|nr:Uma2 family endonuclease [Gemmataceae bacterium]
MKRSLSPPNPFRFGWRDVHQIGPDGSKQWTQVPLTQEEALHPQEGDHISENRQQEIDRRYLTSVLEWRLSGNPQALVLSDCLINWGVPGLGNHSPDISIFDNVNDPEHRNWGTFRVAVEDARCILVMEIVSPDAHDRRVRDNDVVIKVREYYRAGVPLYFIVDQERGDCPRQVIGYRRGARKYLRMRPDRQGRLLLAPVGLLLGLRDERAVCWDADTEEEIGNLTATAQALREAQARIYDLEAQLRRKGGRQ